MNRQTAAPVGIGHVAVQTDKRDFTICQNLRNYSCRRDFNPCTYDSSQSDSFERTVAFPYVSGKFEAAYESQ